MAHGRLLGWRKGVHRPACSGRAQIGERLVVSPLAKAVASKSVTAEEVNEASRAWRARRGLKGSLAILRVREASEALHV